MNQRKELILVMVNSFILSGWAAPAYHVVVEMYMGKSDFNGMRLTLFFIS